MQRKTAGSAVPNHKLILGMRTTNSYYRTLLVPQGAGLQLTPCEFACVGFALPPAYDDFLTNHFAIAKCQSCTPFLHVDHSSLL